MKQGWNCKTGRQEEETQTGQGSRIRNRQESRRGKETDPREEREQEGERRKGKKRRRAKRGRIDQVKSRRKRVKKRNLANQGNGRQQGGPNCQICSLKSSDST